MHHPRTVHAKASAGQSVASVKGFGSGGKGPRQCEHFQFQRPGKGVVGTNGWMSMVGYKGYLVGG